MVESRGQFFIRLNSIEFFDRAMDAVALPLLSSAVTMPGTAKGHVTEPDALAAGLACSGGAQLLGHPLPVSAAAALGTSLADGEPCGLASTADGSAVLVAGSGLRFAASAASCRV